MERQNGGAKEYTEHVKKLLREYPKIKAKIKRLNGKIRRFKKKILLEEYTLNSQDYSNISAGETNKVISLHEEWVVEHLDRFPDLLELINRHDDLVAEKETVEAALEALTPEQRELVELHYFDRYSMVDVFLMMEIGKTKAYDIREEALSTIYSVLMG